jgi:adenylyl cyclase-associated protein
VKKPPSKNFKFNTWYIENYGKEVLKFEGEDVQLNYGWALIKCQDTTLVVDGKCKTVMLENCTNVKVILTSLMTNMEVINCKKVTVTIKEQCPHFSMERTQGIHLYLFPPAKGCKINSTCSQAMVVHYSKEGASEDDEWLDIAIPETNVTTIKGDKLVTECLEGME